MIAWLLVALLDDNGADSAWQRRMFDERVRECVVETLVRAARNGSLEMDRDGGHAAAFDEAWERCRKELGLEKEG